MKISVWKRIEVKDSDLKKDQSLEKEILKSQEEAESPKAKKDLEALEEEIWQAYEECRRAQVVRSTAIHYYGSFPEFDRINE